MNRPGSRRRATAEQRVELEWFRRRIEAVMPQARVGVDAEGWPMVRGRLGWVEGALDRSRFAVYTDRRGMGAKLLAIPGVMKCQMGEGEIRLLFPADDSACLREVMRMIRARSRRVPGSAALAALARGRLRAGGPPPRSDGERESAHEG